MRRLILSLLMACGVLTAQGNEVINARFRGSGGGGGPIAHVVGTAAIQACGSSSVSNCAVTSAGSITSGHTLLVSTGQEGGTSNDISTVTDNLGAGSSYTKIADYVSTGADTHRVTIWCATAAASGTVTVTATPVSNYAYAFTSVDEYSGATCTVDGTAIHADAVSTLLDAGNYTTGTAGSMIFAAANSDASATTYTVGTGMTLRLQAGGADSQATEDRITTTTGSFDVSITQSGSTEGVILAIAVKSQ